MALNLTGKLTHRSACAVGGWLVLAGLAHANSLVDLGYANGLVLNGPEATQSVYFPLPANTQGASLHISLASSAALTPNASVTVLAGGVPLATVPDSVIDGVAKIDVPARFTQGGFLQLSFVAHQGGGGSCNSSSIAPADWTLVQPETALVPNVTGPEGVGDVWRTASTPLTMSLPQKPSLNDVQTALILSTALVERGVAPFFVNDPSSASIVIDPAGNGVAVSNLPNSKNPQLIVPNADAARALVAAAPAISSSVQSSATASFVAPSVNFANYRSFGSLGLSSITVSVLQDAQMDLNLPLSVLPADQHMVGLKLSGRGMALPPGQSEIISVKAGDNVIWSRIYTGTVTLNGESVDIPAPLLASGAKLQLSFAMIGGPQGCGGATPLNFTLGDSSQVVLAHGPPAPIRFAGFSSASGGALPVLTDLPPESLPPALPLLAELLGAADANPMAITVSGTDNIPTQPFILVSHKTGQVVSVAPVPEPGRNIELPLPNQQAAVTLPDQGTYSLLQLVSAGREPGYVPGLWLSPGNPASLKNAALPGDGNVALYDGNSAPSTFLTELHSAQLGGVQKGIIATLVSNWNIELLALCWLFLLAFMVVILVRRRKRK